MSAHDLAGSPSCTARAGEEVRAPCLATLYRQEFAFVWRTLRYLGVPGASVEDAAQEVFITAHRRLADFDPTRGSARSWLYGIARNTARHHHRWARRRDPQRLAAVDAEVAGPAADLAADPEAWIARVEIAEVVEHGLAKLDPRRREVFVLHEIEGLSAPEIAELLGIKVNTVYSRLARARTRFRAAIARHQARERGSHG
ncbi:MAG: RNA polymerase sigma factor [Myxococcales bacterium]|nr:RNA polymerase sigma factor [Myxococcales bacterium]